MSVLKCILQQLCPRCRSGRIFRSSIFRGLPKIHERCPACGLKFEREEGYFVRAMYISYGLALALIGLLSAFVWVFTRWRLEETVAAGSVLFLPTVPILTRFSRVLWIYFDQWIDADES